MKRLKNKLHSRRGETIVEALVSILIISLASAAFLAMMLAATHTNQKATSLTESLYATKIASDAAVPKDLQLPSSASIQFDNTEWVWSE